MLETIIQSKKEEIKKTQFEAGRFEGLRYSLKKALLNPNQSVGLIAEVKQASPSKGVFTTAFDPEHIAKSYESAGADAISVLTDQKFFKGSISYLKLVKQAVHLPVLRKDFIIDERQIDESVAIGADAILLIAAALEPKKLHEFYLKAYEGGLECLVEVHNRQELEALLEEFHPEIIGINNRDLKTFYTTLDTTKEVLPFIPETSVSVSESGILAPEAIDTLKRLGVNGALVGEALMTAETPERGIHYLFGGSSR
ncbi:indole-3-glycerol phosphate synthase [Pullulanibacillus pueri]|uniref:Indole-3-glycerol phosphate synthase n=1 Tax=Pullulanibacillus pueri TaxID=1437324 RepID=A0A8J2ZUA4_9BACL|nr:indole-3-glycerol phosphate synthase TrpC [Pullulanibacillus pueri]MBM7681459.1 indole-3-glycerol phosphate synthase [Pullulanibacillus pueri]GGH78962.1 indole-3-glycerol phosphate synthase [Pullulanibacillus pueri]